MFELLIIFVCLLFNALFSCFEMAFVTVSKAQLRQTAKSGSKSAERILALRESPERTLSVIQVGITLVGMISAAVGGAGAEETFAPFLETRLGVSANAAEVIAVFSVVVPLTFLSVVLGELVPKTIALRHPLMISLAGSRWLSLADRFFSPIVTLMEAATKWVLKLLPKRRPSPATEGPPPVEIGHLSSQTQQYVLNLVGVETMRLQDMMIPMSAVTTIKDSDSLQEIAATAIRSGHTRLPVLRGDGADTSIVGLLHTKEFIAMLATNEEPWQHLIRPIIKRPENTLALQALRLMQESRSHLLVVESTESKPLGIVTLEDIIEEIVGDIYDEDDDGRIRRLMSVVRDSRHRRR